MSDRIKTASEQYEQAREKAARAVAEEALTIAAAVGFSVYRRDELVERIAVAVTEECH